MSLFESSKGILFGLAAAILYAGVIVLNKKMKEILKDEEKHLKEMEEFKKKYEDLFKEPVEKDKK